MKKKSLLRKVGEHNPDAEIAALEKELLEKTLKGSVNILVDILSLANPVAFSQSTRLRKYAVQIAQKLNLIYRCRLP